MAPPRWMMRVVRDHPDRPAVQPGQRGDDAHSELRAQLQYRVPVGEGVDDGADVVGADPVLGHQLAQHPLIRVSRPGPGPARAGRPGPRDGTGRSADVAQVRAGRRDRGGVVGDENVDHAVGHLHRHRPHVARRDRAEAAAPDHRGAAHAEAAALGRDDDVARRGQRGVTGETVAGDDGDQRYLPAQLGEQPERGHVELHLRRTLRRPRSPRSPWKPGRARPIRRRDGGWPAAGRPGAGHPRRPAGRGWSRW